jgi:hypothetical protein
MCKISANPRALERHRGESWPFVGLYLIKASGSKQRLSGLLQTLVKLQEGYHLDRVTLKKDERIMHREVT